MRPENPSLMLRLRSDESGAVIVLVAAAIAGLIGLAALAVDVGNLAYTQRRLQATADMAALAGAAEIGCVTCTSGTENTAANLYSGTAGSKNAQPDLTITMVSGYPKGQCLTNFGVDSGVFYDAATATCTGLDNYNAMKVVEQATVPFTLGQIFGYGSVTLQATSLAGASGTGGLSPLNVMIVLDTTASMNDADTNGSLSTCGVKNPTRIQCATFGVRTLLAELWPTQDQVGLMVFPQVSTGTVSDDYSCSSTAIPTVEPYSTTSGATYQIISASDNYRASNSSSTLSSGSQLANAAGYSGTSSCAGVKSKGGEGTYYAGVINAAQAALVATDNTGVCAGKQCQNVIIFLSDGGAGNASTLASLSSTAATLATGTTLTFASVPSDVIPGSSVADSTNTSAITAGTQVVSTTSTTVTLSGPVTNLGTAATSVQASGTKTLTFASGSLPSGLSTGASVTDSTTTSAIPTGTTVTKATSTTVTLSNAVTVAKGDTIAFGFVGLNDSIAFGTNDQCHEAITAAVNAANAGTWVYSIAYGSSTTLSPPTGSGNNSCSDNEYPSISSCFTMGGGETQDPPIQGIASSPTKFYSDGSGGTGTCSSSNSVSDLGAIFQDIGHSLSYTALLPNNTN
jgi:Flp pilus assembly protein TadG